MSNFYGSILILYSYKLKNWRFFLRKMISLFDQIVISNNKQNWRCSDVFWNIFLAKFRVIIRIDLTCLPLTFDNVF